jgi:hypothetical protein
MLSVFNKTRHCSPAKARHMLLKLCAQFRPASVGLISRCALGNNDHRNKPMLLLLTSTLYEVPKSTLKDKANGKEQYIKKLVNTLIRRKPVLPEPLKIRYFPTALLWKKQFWPCHQSCQGNGIPTGI